MKRHLSHATMVAHLWLVPLACSHGSQPVDEAVEGEAAGAGLSDVASVAEEDSGLATQDASNPDMAVKTDETPAEAPTEMDPSEEATKQDETPVAIEETVPPATNLAALEDAPTSEAPSSEAAADAVKPQEEIDDVTDFTLAPVGTNTEPGRKSKKDVPVTYREPAFEKTMADEAPPMGPVKKLKKKANRNKKISDVKSRTHEPSSSMPADTVSDVSQSYGGKTSIYIVVAGDSLAKIARRLYGDKNEWRQLAEINNISNPLRIFPGQVIKFPTDERTAKFQSKYLDGAKEKVVVQPGDTLGSLAKRVMGKASYWKALWQINADKIPNPNVIRANQVLYYFDMSKLHGADNGTATAY